MSVTAWPGELAHRYVARGYWEQRPLGAYLDAAAAARPDEICLVDATVSLTFAELVSRVDGAAARLRALGLSAGDRVVVQLPNCWEFVVATLACFRSGVAPVMALPAHRRQEVTAVARLTGARALLVAATVKGFDHERLAHEVAAEVPDLKHVLVTGHRQRPDSLDLAALCAPADGAAPGLAPPDPADVALFLLSGGTTGRPKLIPRTHNDYAYMMRRAAQICGAGPGTVYLAVLPLAHGYPMAGPGLLGTLLGGGRAVILPSPAPERALAAVAEHRVTMTSLVPAAVTRWLEHLGTAPAPDLSSLELVQVAGSRLPDEVAARVSPALGARLQQVYGMAEGLLCMTRPADPDEVVHHTQGRPICPDDELLLVDEDGAPVPPGEPGILLTRGPYTPRGYYREPELTAAAYPPGGWYRTGDVVRLRPDGNLVIEGRDKDLINRGGEKIAAEEVENYAHQLPAVSLAAAVAMPDPELGERVCLYVVARPGTEVTLAQVRDVMREAGVAAFKLPDRLVPVDALPVTAIGKVDKKALRADIARRL
ncbi:(2,3-dihydroxybenzoyl)adenylate synthase [Actinoplanes sp. N902-109]|uniref:(2,3-dihydroxybenzoyl)adenylate synthase n=1 Tax=Actinoplanes sp. (strain N902-109) TaxID=649831 RepID=UPI000329619B|nr:AMP-binding protein [Actinoplanes sp. N902-109]AGL16700.1 adenylate ligase [Actinoplanes sp. N902-109]